MKLALIAAAAGLLLIYFRRQSSGGNGAGWGQTNGRNPEPSSSPYYGGLPPKTLPVMETYTPTPGTPLNISRTVGCAGGAAVSAAIAAKYGQLWAAPFAGSAGCFVGGNLASGTTSMVKWTGKNIKAGLKKLIPGW